MCLKPLIKMGFVFSTWITVVIVNWYLCHPFNVLLLSISAFKICLTSMGNEWLFKINKQTNKGKQQQQMIPSFSSESLHQRIFFWQFVWLVELVRPRSVCKGLWIRFKISLTFLVRISFMKVKTYFCPKVVPEKDR